MGFAFDERVLEHAKKTDELCISYFKEVERIAELNQQKILSAFQESKVSATHFVGTTGYGYDDRGREVLDEVFAKALDAEDALVRHNIVSGTHALTIALFGLLRTGDTLFSITGRPYDTLEGVIGLSGDKGEGSLKEFGISYKECLLKDGAVDFAAVRENLSEDVKVVFIQRSRGYDANRPTFSAEEIGEIAKKVKEIKKNVVVMVDNCYGEFTNEHEPTYYGADVIVGSLIKNPGGGIAKCGGYIAGKKEYVEKISYRLTSPGIGRECGATLGQNESMFLGLFLAPHIVLQALKTAIYCAAFYKGLSFSVNPEPETPRNDIIQSIIFHDRDKLIAFCEGIQKGAPVDSYVTPEPWAMPGYSCDVIMAAGNFVQGATTELSADAPLREPYAAYMQGALTFESGKTGVMLSAETMLKKGMLRNLF